MRRIDVRAQPLPISAAEHIRFAGMSAALGTRMTNRSESWTIPFHVVMWANLSIGLIMTMVVFLMHC